MFWIWCRILCRCRLRCRKLFSSFLWGLVSDVLQLGQLANYEASSPFSTCLSKKCIVTEKAATTKLSFLMCPIFGGLDFVPCRVCYACSLEGFFAVHTWLASTTVSFPIKVTWPRQLKRHAKLCALADNLGFFASAKTFCVYIDRLNFFVDM